MSDMKKIKLFIILSLGFMLVACDEHKSNQDFKTISVGKAFDEMAGINASDCFESIRYIPLETVDSALIGDQPEIIVAGDRLVVFSKGKQCLVFSRADGKFLNSIGHIGPDPQGAQSLSDWVNADAGEIHFPAGNGRQVVYDLSGKFLRDYHFPDVTDGFFGVDHFTYLSDTLNVAHLPATASKPDRLLYFRDGNLFATCPSRGDSISPLGDVMSQISSMNAFRDSESGFQIMHLVLKDGRIVCMVPNERLFWHNGDDLYFRQAFNDTVYHVQETGLEPAYRFDYGAYHWARADHFLPDRDKAIYPLDIFENDRIIWMRFAMNILHSDDWTFYNAVYDKRSGTTRVSSNKDGATDDRNGFMPLRPTTSSADGTFAQIMMADELAEWIEENGGPSGIPAGLEALSAISPEDNPLVILME